MNSSTADSTPSFRTRLRVRFADFVSRQRETTGSLLNAFRERRWRAFAFGGTPRGVWDEGPSYQPRDLDIVFEDSHFEDFASVFRGCIQRRTRFDGLHLKIGGLAVDAWSLSATWAFRQGLVSEASFENLPRTTFFNADAIVVSLLPKSRGREFYESGFRRAWEDRILDINLEANPFPALCVVRAFRLASHFHFHFSPRLLNYVAQTMNGFTDGELADLQAAHYGHIFFPPARLAELRRTVTKHWQKSPILPLRLFPGQLRFWPPSANFETPKLSSTGARKSRHA